MTRGDPLPSSTLKRDNKLVPVSPDGKRLQNPHIFVLCTKILDAGAMCERVSDSVCQAGDSWHPRVDLTIQVQS